MFGVEVSSRRNEKYFTISLVLISSAIVAIRLMSTLIFPYFLAWDPWEYYHTLLVLEEKRINIRYGTASYYISGIVYILLGIVEASDITPFEAVKWVSPITYSLVIIPAIYSLTKLFLNSRRNALIALLLFAVSDIAVLRESYTIAEGIAIPLSLIAILALVNYYLKENMFDLIIFSIVSSSVILSHSLTTLVMMGLLAIFPSAIAKVERSREKNVKVALMITLPALIIFSTPAHRYIEIEFYKRVEMFLRDILEPKEPTSVFEALTTKYSAVPKSYLELVFHHISTLVTGFLALVASIAFVKKRGRREPILLSWLLATLAFFVLSILGDYYFGWLFDFYGYRAWIFTVTPAVILASYTLSRVEEKKQVLVLPIIILISSLGTISFLQHQFSTMNRDISEIESSNWFIARLPANSIVFSPNSFIVSNENITSVKSVYDVKFFIGNMSSKLSIIRGRGSSAVYVYSSRRATNYPFFTSYLYINYSDIYASKRFIRIYDSQQVWAWYFIDN